MTTRFLLAVGLLAVSAGAHSTTYVLPLKVSLTENGDVRVCIKSRFARKPLGANLRSISFYEPAASLKEPIWSLYARSADLKPVNCFKYGEIVGGLTQVVAPLELQLNKRYEIMVMRPGEAGAAYFKLVKFHDRKKLEILTSD